MRIIKSDSNPLLSKAVDDGPLVSLRFPTSSEVNWTTPSHLVDVSPPAGTLEASRNGYVTKLCEYLTKMVRRFPLMSQTLGYVGEKLDNVESAVGEIRSLEVKDQIVSKAGNFTINAFNKAYEMHVKKGEHKHFKFMECKYFRVSISNYYFYIAIEAIEEGNPSAYVAEVAWNLSDGRLTALRRSMFLQWKILAKNFLGTLRVGGTTCGYDYYNPYVGTCRPEENTPNHPSFLKIQSKEADVAFGPGLHKVTHRPKPNKTIRRQNEPKLSPSQTGYGPEAARWTKVF
nr:40S ribosomal protein S13 [Tanacetum cinerariifolium]